MKITIYGWSTSPSFLDSSVKLGVSRANGVLPKVREQSGLWTPAAARLGHQPARQLGNTLRRLELATNQQLCLRLIG
jgi:hypothetical protein